MSKGDIQEFQIQLLDKRKLSVAVYGNSSYHPVVFFHGFGSSKFSIHPNLELLEQNKIHMISIDRPGIGKSDLRRNYTPCDFAKDVQEVLNHLRLNKVGVCGWSAGGLYSQVFATMFPDKIVSLSLVSSAIPLSNGQTKNILPHNWKIIVLMNTYFPILAKLFFKQQYKAIQKKFDNPLEKFIKKMNDTEKLVLSDVRINNMLLHSTQQAYTNQELGVYYDARALCRPLLFGTDNIKFSVNIWQGDRDKIWTVRTSKFLNDTFKNSNLFVIENEGHLLLYSHWNDILATIRNDFEAV